MSQATTSLPRAIELHRAGDLAEAETLYRNVLDAMPGHPVALNLLGVACSQQGRHDEAEHFLRDAVAARPHDAAMRYNLGNVLRERGELRAALVEFEAVVEVDPAHASAHFNLGATWQELDEPDRAAAAFARTLDVDPDHPRALECMLNVAVRRHLAGAHDEAVEMLQAFTARAPDVAAGWCNLGLALQALDRADDARAAFERAATLDPSIESAGTNLALAHLEAGDATAALRTCRRLLDHAPQSSRAHRTMASILVAIGEADLACTHLQEAGRLEPACAAIALEHADAHRRIGRLDAADLALERAIELDAACAAAWKGRVDLALLRGDDAAAATHVNALRKTFPDSACALLAMGTVALRDDRPADAVDLLERASSTPAPDGAFERAALYGLGRAHEMLGAYDDAWDAFVRANAIGRTPLDRDALSARVDAIIETFPGAAGDSAFTSGAPDASSTPGIAPASPRPVFMAGMPRSGSTLLEQILDAHPAVAGGGEAMLLGRLANRFPDDADPFPRGARSLSTAARATLAEFGRVELSRLARGHEVVVEKTLTNTFYLGLIETLFPHARVVICERDPRDAGLSCFQQDFENQPAFSTDPHDICFYRRELDRLVAHWRETLRLPTLTVRYEDLVTDPERIMRDVVEFCGLPWDPACLDFAANPRTTLTASNAQVRRAIYASSVGRWRRYEGVAGWREAFGG